MAEYRLIDMEHWSRAEHFRHFFDEAPCTVSLCDDVDVTELREACRESGQSFYISILYAVSRTVNAHDEFRMMAVDSPAFEHLMPAVWEASDPVHNVFHEDRESFTTLCTRWNPDFAVFSAHAKDDLARAARADYRSVPCGENTFETSCVPWRHFTSVGVQSEAVGLAPIIVWGGWKEMHGRTYMPLSVQIHHAAADGFHLARFLNETEETLAHLAKEMRRMTL